MRKKNHHLTTLLLLFLLLTTALAVLIIRQGIFSKGLMGIKIDSLVTETISENRAPETTSRPSLLSDLLSPVTNTPVQLPTIPPQKLLTSNYHVFQTFNNCGPASLSMALAHYGITETQQYLGNQLRPYQNPQGNNDDKSVTLEELADFAAKEYDFIAFHRPVGNMELVEQFIAQDIPVITRTLLVDGDDIGHYRVIKGYNQDSQTLIQDDSLQGKDLQYSYQDFYELWKPFNFEYLLLVSPEKVEIITAILGENADEDIAWQNAVASAEQEVSANPNDMYAQLNLSVALYKTGQYQQSVETYEKVADRLPMRTLWYQIEPILSYYELGKYDDVFKITDSILNNQNRAFTELYILRGKIYQQRNQPELAKSEFEKAVLYNSKNNEAKQLVSEYSN